MYCWLVLCRRDKQTAGTAPSHKTTIVWLSAPPTHLRPSCFVSGHSSYCCVYLFVCLFVLDVLVDAFTCWHVASNCWHYVTSNCWQVASNCWHVSSNCWHFLLVIAGIMLLVISFWVAAACPIRADNLQDYIFGVSNVWLIDEAWIGNVKEGNRLGSL